MFTYLYTFIILSIIGSSFFSRRVPLFGLILLLPFYTILRETASTHLVFFLWPYILISIMIVREVLLNFYLGNSRNLSAAILTIHLILLSGLLFVILSKDLSTLTLINISSAFSKNEIIYMLGTVVIFYFSFLRVYFREIKQREGNVSLLDWLLAAFLFYGILHIYISYFNGKDVFNAILGFRYYFSMSAIFLLFRLIASNRKDFFICAGIVASTLILSSLFMLVEGILLNVLNVDPQNLPWSGYLASEFGYSPDVDKLFLESRYIPMGTMYMTHFSGVLSVLGFALIIPFAYIYKRVDKQWKFIIIISILLHPLVFIYTSKTALILFYISLLTVVILQFSYWRKSLWLMPLFAIVIPLLYSYYLIPGMTYDYGRVVSYMVSPATATKEERYLHDGSIPVTKAEFDKTRPPTTEAPRKKGNDGWFYNQGMTNERVVGNAFSGILNSIKKDISVNSTDGKNIVESILFGHGYKISTWSNKLKNNIDINNEFNLSTESDTPYLNFVFEFGLIGLILLVLFQSTAIIYAFLAYRLLDDVYLKAFSIGILSVILLSAVGMGHLGILFKTGLNTIIFLMIALSVMIYKGKIYFVDKS